MCTAGISHRGNGFKRTQRAKRDLGRVTSRHTEGEPEQRSERCRLDCKEGELLVMALGFFVFAGSIATRSIDRNCYKKKEKPDSVKRLVLFLCLHCQPESAHLYLFVSEFLLLFSSYNPTTRAPSSAYPSELLRLKTKTKNARFREQFRKRRTFFVSTPYTHVSL